MVGIQPKGWRYSKSNGDFDLVDGWAQLKSSTQSGSFRLYKKTNETTNP